MKRILLISINDKLKIRKVVIPILFFSFLFSSCSKLIQVDPPYTSINKDNVFNNEATSIAVLTNILAELSNGNYSLGGNVSNLFLFGGLYADELTLYTVSSPIYTAFYSNALTQNIDLGYWNSTYSLIFYSNSAIDGLEKNSQLSSSVRNQLLGEAKFLRAFFYFYLVNLYGDVPLVLGIDPLENATLSRSTTDQVYSQIISDLVEAQDLLSDDFRSGNVISSTSERVRPTKWAAKALIARVYLFEKDYLNAEKYSTEVINNNALFNLDSLNSIFLKNSRESIWQLQSTDNTKGNTGEGNIFILPQTGPDDNSYPVYLSSYVLNSFEDGDQRKAKWVDSVIVDSNTIYYYPYKYKSGALNSDGSSTEYEVVFRLGEQFLIRAEARAQLNNISGSQNDLNTIRLRAGLGETLATQKSELLVAIFHERQIELFSEWGHRWLDLKRTNNVDIVMNKVAAEKGGVWSSTHALWPIALAELYADSKLVQNPGY